MIKASLARLARYSRMICRWGIHRVLNSSTVTISGVKLALDHPSLSPKMKFNLRLGHYEAHEQVLLRKCLRQTDRVLEIGAGIGFLSNLAARIVPSQNITAVEANPDLIDLIKRNQKLNGVEFLVVNGVLGKGSDRRDFYVTPNFWASGLAPIQGAHKISVPQLDFQEFLLQTAPNVLVIDIEGGEGELLEGVTLPGVRTVIIELHPAVLKPKEISRVFNALAAQGLYPDLSQSSGMVYVFVAADDS